MLGMSVKQMLATVDSHELTEWMVFFKLENESAEQAQMNANVSTKVTKKNGNRR